MYFVYAHFVCGKVPVVALCVHPYASHSCETDPTELCFQIQTYSTSIKSESLRHPKQTHLQRRQQYIDLCRHIIIMQCVLCCVYVCARARISRMHNLHNPPVRAAATADSRMSSQRRQRTCPRLLCHRHLMRAAAGVHIMHTLLTT